MTVPSHSTPQGVGVTTGTTLSITSAGAQTVGDFQILITNGLFPHGGGSDVTPGSDWVLVDSFIDGEGSSSWRSTVWWRYNTLGGTLSETVTVHADYTEVSGSIQTYTGSVDGLASDIGTNALVASLGATTFNLPVCDIARVQSRVITILNSRGTVPAASTLNGFTEDAALAATREWSMWSKNLDPTLGTSAPMPAVSVSVGRGITFAISGVAAPPEPTPYRQLGAFGGVPVGHVGAFGIKA